VTRLLLAAQGIYYVLAGAWPLVSMSAFEAVTGPKTDDWLVRTVGVLAAAIGATLLVGARTPAPRAEAVVLAVLSACGFAAIDLVYGLSGRISRIYLADAAVEIALALGIVLSSWSRATTPPAS
jgi:hypothetical protein